MWFEGMGLLNRHLTLPHKSFLGNKEQALVIFWSEVHFDFADPFFCSSWLEAQATLYTQKNWDVERNLSIPDIKIGRNSVIQ